jgi:CRISPR-associated protein Csm1
MTPRQQRLLLYTFLHDIDAFLGEKTKEFARQLCWLFPGIVPETLLTTGKREFSETMKIIREPAREPHPLDKLTAIFSKVALRGDTLPVRHPFRHRILRFDQSFLTGNKETRWEMQQQFLAELRHIPRGTFSSTYETLVSLVEKYTAFLPTPHREHEGVSLFDHLRLSAAMAICTRAATVPSPYRIVAGELLGIEDFIYNIATPEGHQGQAKSLRGRSFYCLVLTQVISHFLLHKLGLPITNLLWAGGELFAFLAPNTAEAQTKISNGERAINQWFLQEHEGRMFLGLAQVEATARDLVEDYTATFAATFAQLQQANRRRFASLWQSDNPDVLLRSSALDPTQGRVMECNICQKDFFWTDDVEEELRARCLTCQVQYHLGGLLPKVPYYVEACADAGLADDLRHELIFFLDFPFAGENEPVFYWVFPRERRWGNELQTLLPFLRDKASIIRLIRPNDTEFLPERELANAFPPFSSFSFSTIANTVPFNPQPEKEREVLEFANIADYSGGAKYLAALKMDVDNFTRVFTDGLKNGGARTLAHYMTLSRSFSYFFLGHINTIAHQKEYLIPSFGTGDEKRSSTIYTVFAGGDDLFLLGPWDVVIEVAYRIRNDFMHYTLNPQHLTISAGITYFKPTFPIRRFAHLTSEAIEAAKKPKDALSLFGEVLHWERLIKDSDGSERLSFVTLRDFAQRLEKLVEEGRSGEGISHSFLMNLLMLKRTFLDQHKIDWKWHLPYLLAQAGVTKAGQGEKKTLLAPLVDDDARWFRSLEVPLMWVLLKTRRS